MELNILRKIGDVMTSLVRVTSLCRNLCRLAGCKRQLSHLMDGRLLLMLLMMPMSEHLLPLPLTVSKLWLDSLKIRRKLQQT